MTSRRHAFSLVEVIVVIVIMAVLAAVVVPRITGMAGRRVRASAEAVADLLATASRRTSLTSQQAVVGYNHEANSVGLSVLVADEGDSTLATWRDDRLAQPVLLDDTVLVAVEADGGAMDPAAWRFEFIPGVRRPNLAIVLGDAHGGEQWRVELPATTDQAVVSPGSHGVLADLSIDLDAAGAGSAAW